MPNSLKPKDLSDAITGSLTKAYRAGGIVLALLTLGATLMLAAVFWPAANPLRYVLISVGSVLVLFVVVVAYTRELRPIARVRSRVRESKEIIDTTQRAAVELTELASDLQALAFKHASKVSEVVVGIRPLIGNLPIVGGLTRSPTFMEAEKLSQSIVDLTHTSRRVIEDIRKALVESKPEHLRKYVDDIHEYKNKVEALLGK